MGLLIDRFVAQHALQTLAFSGQTPAGRADRNQGPMYLFPDSQDTYIWFNSVVSRSYNSAGIIATVRFEITATGDVFWEVVFERHATGVTDLSLTTNFSAGQTGIVTATNANREYSGGITLTHAQAGSLQLSESYRVRVGRLGTNGSDTCTGDARFMSLELRNST